MCSINYWIKSKLHYSDKNNSDNSADIEKNILVTDQ